MSYPFLGNNLEALTSGRTCGGCAIPPAENALAFAVQELHGTSWACSGRRKCGYVDNLSSSPPDDFVINLMNIANFVNLLEMERER
jgi:hypothetical protein